MTEIEKVQKLMLGYVEKWQWVVKKFDWEFDVYWVAETRDMPRGSGLETLGTCRPNFPYMNGVIRFDLEKSSEYLDDESYLEETVLHELVHLLIAPVMENQQSVRLELVVTWVTRVLLSLEKRYNSKKAVAKKK